MKNIDEIAALLIEQRKNQGIEQKDMYMRIGMKQQQYQRIEAGSDVKLSTLLRVLEGLDLELSIVPKGGKAAPSLGERISDSQSEFGKDKGDLEDDSDDLGFWFNSEDNS
ncbi:helix-turn-helix transcriptional regulator [Vibrio sp. YMD68]|uniref:helix-turn-helix domain-containing protein n=1 Tax=Vibrio sp. YMD68 TaxID=3042300 RepID=UPI00249A9D86|nr:helix-turn-helix transcriptional regulator [Vibrio sp. YMD68]WGW01032.1 helix-turn-helix transcriptional regulator [Vibrio sp. YMD68]